MFVISYLRLTVRFSQWYDMGSAGVQDRGFELMGTVIGRGLFSCGRKNDGVPKMTDSNADDKAAASLVPPRHSKNISDIEELKYIAG